MRFQRAKRSKKYQTTTFKHIAFPEYQKFENQEEREFDSILAKQKTIDTVNALEFENSPQKCRKLIDNLLTQYDLLHPEPEQLIMQKSVSKEYSLDQTLEQNCQDHVIEEFIEEKKPTTQTCNLKLKSDIIFLELENKKLQLKLNLLEKKYQKEFWQQKISNNFYCQNRKNQKQFLEVELTLLKELKSLSEELKNFGENTDQSQICVLSHKQNFQVIQKVEPKGKIGQKKKINRLNCLKYLLQKAQKIQKPEQFMQVLQKLQKRYDF